MTDTRPDPSRPPRPALQVLRPDLPTRAGVDPDHPLARGLVGRDGPSIAHLGDLEALLPEPADTAIEICGDTTGPWILAMLSALAERRGTVLRGALCLDAVAIRQGPAAPPWSDAAALDLSADTLSWTRRAQPRLRGARLHIPVAEAGLLRGMALALRSGLALLAATARREKPLHLLAAAEGIDFVMPGDSATHRASGKVFSGLWALLLAERHGPDFARRDDLLVYRADGARVEVATQTAPPTQVALREALERIEAEAAPWPVAGAPAIRTEAQDDAPGAALTQWRRARDNNAVQKSLLALREAAKRGINVMGPSVACAKAGVTTGEWAAVMTAALPGAAPLIPAEALPPSCKPMPMRLSQAALGLARPITLLLARPGLDARPPDALPLLREAVARGIDLRDCGSRRPPAEIGEAVMRERPHALVFCLVSPQAVELALETLQLLQRAGFGSIPAIGLADNDIDDQATLEKLSPMTIRHASELSVDEFLDELATLVMLRKKTAR